jgi:hypothetical protein
MMSEFRVWIRGKRRPDLDRPSIPFRNCRAYHLYLKKEYLNAGVIVLTPHTTWRAKSDPI